ncbi:MAG: sugar phosphate nucleotidyltransferase [Bacteroidota bacterium]
MKAIIPVAGAGTRLRPHTYTQPKPLIPVAGKTIISFIIDQLKAVGVRDFVYVIGHLGEKIQNYVENNYPELNNQFVYQNSREGSAHALWTARSFIKGADEIYIVFGDTILDVDFKALIEKPQSCVGVKKVADPREFGVVELEDSGIIRKMVEKPNIPKSNLAMVGLYKIREVDLLIEVIEDMIREGRQTHGEYQLTDGLMGMIDRGIQLSTITVDNWFDCGKKEVLLETNAMMLDKGGYASSGLPNYDNSIIIHPVSIASNCEISNSIVGPHVTIGPHSKINNSIVQESIIGSYASIADIVLKESIVGSDAAITGMSQSLNIGDNTEIDFSRS